MPETGLSRSQGTGSGFSRRWNALDPGFHGVRTPWIRGFMTFQLARHTRIVMLTVPV
jgi:hypothetical protein